ncbi:MAG: hypothetical protein ACO3OJ_12195, partial [Paracoccaceae bacterium]
PVVAVASVISINVNIIRMRSALFYFLYFICLSPLFRRAGTIEHMLILAVGPVMQKAVNDYAN